jgi:cytoskeletal protein CcmA (bactofilin family)
MSFWKKKNQENSSIIEEETPNKSVLENDYKALDVPQPAGEVKAPDTVQVNNHQTQNPSLTGIQQAGSQQTGSQQPEASYSKVRSALSAGTVIQGKLSFDTPVRIDGKLSGEVYSSKVLIVGETAQISANIEASSLIIMGKLKGTIKASEKVQICSGADVEATVISPSLIIEGGARFNGSSDMKSAAALSQNKEETKVYADSGVDLGEVLDKSSKAKNKSEKNGASSGAIEAPSSLN